MAVKTITYSMPRGDSRSLPLAVPVATYSTGASIFFTLKTVVDNNIDDSQAVLTKTLTDANITSNDGTNVNYLLSLVPSDTNTLTPLTYFAEFEFVNAAKTQVITYPDPSIAQFKIQITGDVTRRTS